MATATTTIKSSTTSTSTPMPLSAWGGSSVGPATSALSLNHQFFNQSPAASSMKADLRHQHCPLITNLSTNHPQQVQWKQYKSSSPSPLPVQCQFKGSCIIKKLEAVERLTPAWSHQILLLNRTLFQTQRKCAVKDQIWTAYCIHPQRDITAVSLNQTKTSSGNMKQTQTNQIQQILIHPSPTHPPTHIITLKLMHTVTISVWCFNTRF